MDSKEQEFKPNIDDLEAKKDIKGLIKALKHEDHIVRKQAAVSLKKVGNESAVEALIEALNYEKWEDKYTVLIAVRENAAEALGKIGDKRAIEPLIKALFEDTDEEVRWKAAAALGKIGDPLAVEPLIHALNDKSWTVRRNVTISLGDLGDERAFDFILKSMNDKDWHVRKYAAVALGKIGDERAIDPLMKALNDEDGDVRWKSIIALGNIGTSAVEPLLKAFETDNWQTKSRVAEVLGKIGDKRAVSPLIQTLNNKNQNKYVRGRIIEALGKIGDERAVEPLIKALDDKYIYVRLKAENALDTIKTKGTGSWIVHYENGEISFDYPHSWEIIETTDEKKVIKGGVANNAINFSINRLEEAEDIKVEEFSGILKNVFLMQNSKIISEMEFKAKDMDAIILVGENPHKVSLTKIMIIAFKKKDLLFYLWFAGEHENFELFNEDIDFIVDSFHIQNS
ncbi:HEAT repeat domain-containing protein [Methanobacterium spitsbergense]|uniref:HEAT repeat domain-containing protein n=1 Tax=Methanobacterium spitsbergense TaxID=2874285 RepID=A0A8T5URT6_9EURY|nr:HEAT repeat domain-containing protein [Methanobacterium spitsbergense]MBZ2164676.1 HEAT repeat domain-containing protein [Methanobacterium spitsbergense]